MVLYPLTSEQVTTSEMAGASGTGSVDSLLKEHYPSLGEEIFQYVCGKNCCRPVKCFSLASSSSCNIVWV